jgi:hypothetical protein
MPLQHISDMNVKAIALLYVTVMWMMLKQNNSTSHSDVNDITAMTLWHVNYVKSMTLYNSDMTHVIAMVLWHSDVEGLISNGNMTQWCWMIPKQWHYDTVMWRSQFKAMALCHCDVEGYTYKQLHYYNVMLKDIKAMELWLSDVEGNPLDFLQHHWVITVS